MPRISFLLLTTAVFVYSTPLSAWSQSELPEGSGKRAIQSYCVQCHDLSTVTRAGYSEQGWRNNLDMMINVGATLPKDQVTEVAQYLAKNFPERPMPPAVVIPGNAQVTIKEWIVPTPGSRPHDPLATADGAIWYTGQFANVLGRLDPKTGKIKEFPLTPKAGPHGLVADKEGNIWYTANFGSRVGKLNPKTGELTEYLMPDPAARDPHTPVFDQKGVLWFTVQNGNFIGRLDPSIGAVTLKPALTPKAMPHGIVIDRVGRPIFAMAGTNKIGIVDPKTMGIQEIALPEGARPRRLAV